MALYRLNRSALADALFDPTGPEHVEVELTPVAGRRGPRTAPTQADEALRAPLEALVGEGLSGRAIACALTGAGHRTPRGYRWHSAAVKRLRERLGMTSPGRAPWRRIGDAQAAAQAALRVQAPKPGPNKEAEAIGPRCRKCEDEERRGYCRCEIAANE